MRGGRCQRKKKKRVNKAAYFRPYETVLRIPYTLGSELAGMVRAVVEQEGRRRGRVERVCRWLDTTGSLSLDWAQSLTRSMTTKLEINK